MYELNQRVVAVIDGSEEAGTIVGRTFEDEPRYDVLLSDGSTVANIRTIRPEFSEITTVLGENDDGGM